MKPNDFLSPTALFLGPVGYQYGWMCCKLIIAGSVLGKRNQCIMYDVMVSLILIFIVAIVKNIVHLWSWCSSGCNDDIGIGCDANHMDTLEWKLQVQ